MASAHPESAPLSRMRFALFVLIFSALAVGIPFVAHIIHPLAGPVFLPMHFVVIAGALVFGWRFGLILGLASPILNHVVTGLPPAFVLTQITIEVAAYGLIAGLLRDTLRLPVITATLLTLIAGRAVLLVFLVAANAAGSAWGSITVGIEKGWPGLAVQIVLLPVAIPLLMRYLRPSGMQR